MSKLFDALESLEKQAERPEVGIPVQFSPPEPVKRRRPFGRVMVVLGLSIVTGIVLVGLAWQYRDGSFDLQRVLAPQPPVEQVKNEVTPLPSPPTPPSPAVAEPSPQAVSSPLPADTQPSALADRLPPPLPATKAKSAEKPVIAAPEQQIRDEYDDVLQFAESVPPAKAETDPAPGQVSKAVKTSLGTVAAPADPDPRQEELARQAARIKKLIYQAEKARQQGDLVAAARFFETAWEIGGNPAVANNLAAIYIEQGQFDQAALLLARAVLLAPDDPDLQYNLNIVRERRR